MNYVEKMIAQHARAAYAREEVEIREELTNRIEHAIENANVNQRKPMGRVLAEAAVDALDAYVRERMNGG